MNTQNKVKCPPVIRDSMEIASAMAKHYLKRLDELKQKEKFSCADLAEFQEIRKVLSSAKMLLNA